MAYKTFDFHSNEEGVGVSSDELDASKVGGLNLNEAKIGVPGVALFQFSTNVTQTLSKAIPAGRKFRVLFVQGYKTIGAGGAGATLTIARSGSTIVTAIDLNIADQTNFSSVLTDDATMDLDGDSGHILQALFTKGAGTVGAVAAVWLVRIK